VRWVCLMLLIATALPAAPPPPASPAPPAEGRGRAIFLDCDFPGAAHVFEQALAAEPDRPALHFWLGKSYARMAETASPFTAPSHARKARLQLETAVRLDPRNPDYLRELFEFYLDSPSYFPGGLERAAALLERLGPGGYAKSLAAALTAHSGVAWHVQRAELFTAAALGRLLP